jgi:hypothetical protein
MIGSPIRIQSYGDSANALSHRRRDAEEYFRIDIRRTCCFWLLRVVSCAVVRTETRLVKAEEDARAVGALTSGRTTSDVALYLSLVLFVLNYIQFEFRLLWVLSFFRGI